jgi:hypothetical protein
VALYLQQDDGGSQLSALVSQPMAGRLKVLQGDETLLDENWTAVPDVPGQWELPAAAGSLTIQFLDGQDNILLAYQSN